MNRQDELDALHANLSIYRSMTFELLTLLPCRELDHRSECLKGVIADLKRLWGPKMSIRQANMIDAYEVIEFRIRHREKFAQRNETGRNKPYFFCRKCETDIIFRRHRGNQLPGL